MPPVTMIEGLSDAERLQALRRERGFAWNVACDVAARSNVTVSPSLSLYGITEIEHLARRFGGSALHWSEA
ncbi:hypothetical protein [Pseudomonas savastanoi]|uniref:hypothetical protein n=1 Tax=Pseudomonas savastanoi TaxID=29438 RepID=UPI000576F0F4|nr:hypothetical protein [Pseudomonas savastanoi]MBN3471705.1 hypothetical protein [Pseudomonas savastanoi pv. phaseolicola]MBN3478677.1 hypothetical protein [Pseudomonas savastanoi pv. phaseolicola]RMM67137.1 hypothetical protein ALQ75_200226 [Pseudomonas savastanoi pv. glycinea]RMM96528.1 hypothetical protein ALQ68_05441 [Pseudomonas savastanoi pv. glycinea]RMQ01999.1 hypothetical protein ALQ13_200036 [Pseudomonas savastanoi pv. glycinea]